MTMAVWLSILTLMISAAFAADAEQFVVVESSAADVPIGKELSPGAPISVPDSARVVLVGSSGQVVTLTGPFQGVPKADAPGEPQSRVFEAIASLAARSGTTMGVSRAAGPNWRAAAARKPDDVFAVDATEGGDTCLYDLSKARLTRDPSAPPGETKIQAMESQAAATIAWKQGAAYMPWPRQVPLADGGSYLIEQAGQESAAVATVHLLRSDPAMTGVQRAALLAEKGCDAQARLLLAIIARPAP